MADIRCQMCGKANPNHLDECQHCGARLKPLTGSLPTSQPNKLGSGANWADASQEDTLGWLRSLGQDEAAAEEDMRSFEADDELPDWLSAPEDEKEVPDWMHEGKGDSPFVDTSSLSDQNTWDVPDADPNLDPWLSEDSNAPENDATWFKNPSGGAFGDSGSNDQNLWETPDSEALNEDWLSSGKGREEDEPEDFIPGGISASSSKESDLPSWLNDTVGEPEQSPSKDDDWLQSFGSDEDMVQTISMDDWGSGPPAKDKPNWLASTPEPPTQPISEEEFGDLPAWLSGGSDRKTGSSAVADDAIEEGEFPDWLSTLNSDTGSSGKLDNLPNWMDKEMPEPATSSTSFEETDWLASLGDEPAMDLEPEDNKDTKQDWVAGAGFGNLAGSYGTIGGLTIDDEDSIAGEIKKSDLPDWLSSIKGDRQDTSETSNALSEVSPSWGSRTEPDQGSTFPASSALEESDEEISTTGGLPSWVQAFRPMEGAEIANEFTEGDPERVGPLAGLRGVLNAEADIAKSIKPPVHTSSLQVSSKQQANATLLQTLVETEGDLKPLLEVSPLTTQRVIRVVMGVILILAILLPLFSGTQVIPSPLSLPDEAQAIQTHIGSADTSTQVLLAFDYDPSLSGELDIAAMAVIDQLMDREARLILVSTSPLGPGLGERHIAGLQSKFPYEHQYEYGTDYVNLGYIAGGATGLNTFANTPRQLLPIGYDNRSLWELFDVDASNPWLTPVMQNIVSLSDIAFTIVLTDDPDIARNWIEQVGPGLRNNSLLMIVSAQAEPFIRPYFQPNNPVESQVAGILAGLRGGVAYEAALGQAGVARLVWDAFGVGLLVALILILVGGTYNFFSLVNESRKKKRTK